MVWSLGGAEVISRSKAAAELLSNLIGTLDPPWKFLVWTFVWFVVLSLTAIYVVAAVLHFPHLIGGR
jgi:hypothetical protein